MTDLIIELECQYCHCPIRVTYYQSGDTIKGLVDTKCDGCKVDRETNETDMVAYANKILRNNAIHCWWR